MNQNADKISDTEAEVMRVIWQSESPMTYAEIRVALHERFEWGNQMINTLLKRLVQKEVLLQERREVYYYSPLVSEEDYRRSRTCAFVQKVYGGSGKGLLTALVNYDEVTPGDLEELKELWRKGRDADV